MNSYPRPFPNLTYMRLKYQYKYIVFSYLRAAQHNMFVLTSSTYASNNTFVEVRSLGKITTKKKKTKNAKSPQLEKQRKHIIICRLNKRGP